MPQYNNIAPDMEEYDADLQPRRRRRTSPDDTPASGKRPVPDSNGPSRPKKRKPEKNSQNYNLMSFLRDERLHIGIGIVLCIAAIVSVCMCISFISSNEADQSVMAGRAATEIVESNDQVDNAGKTIGAQIAHVLMVDTFGLSSMIMALYFFLIGLACMGLKKISFWALSFRCLFTTAALSIIIGLITFNHAGTFPLGGYHGMYINRLLLDYSGALGAFAVTAILVGLLIAVYYYPLKNIFTAIASLFPKRNGSTADGMTEKPEHSALDELGDETEDEEACATVEESTGAETPATDIKGYDTIPGADLEALGNDESDTADDSISAITIEPLPLNSETELLPTSDSGTPTSGESAPGEPELVIVNKTESEDTANEPIRNGDHIGLDRPYDPRDSHSNYVFPSTELLLERANTVVINAEEQAANKQMIVNSLRSYNIEIVRIEATIGPTVTLYEIVPTEGTRIAKIKSLEEDIAMSLKALGIRIIAPMPGRGTIGIEVPNRNPQIVSMRTVLESKAFKNNRMRLPMALGATISNDMFVVDLTKMPHLLVAGATGQGKSVGLNCIITSLLYSKHPDELKFVLIDPKMVEFTLYRRIANAYMAKIPEEDNAIITDPQKVIATLNSLCVEMDRRYELLSDAGVRDLEAYNERFRQRRLNPENGHRFLPYIVMIVDEFADLITTAGKDISVPISRIAQKARAVGMHMIIATQRPSTDIITGMIKANFPARIAFRVLSGVDSKTILDRPGAHRLIGRGDMLTLINGATERVQCAFVDTEEIEAICEHISSQPGFTAPYELPEVPADSGGDAPVLDVNLRNEEFNRCALFISQQSQASITILQRKFQIGFNKAGRYMDQMEALGIVGPANGAKPRQVLMTPDEVSRLISSES